MKNYRTFSDTYLLEILKTGDREAFRQIYERYKGLLYVHAYKRLEDSDEAEDVVHDVLAKLWLTRENIDVKSGNLAGYLYASIRNLVLTSISRKGYADQYIKVELNDYQYAIMETDYVLREKQLREIIERNIGLLPKKMREIFVLSRKGQLSHKEISEQLGISDKTVKSQINNALNILRSKLGSVIFLWFLLKNK
jgi:RNA polymerase sigma-70 factor (family 1)